LSSLLAANGDVLPLVCVTEADGKASASSHQIAEKVMGIIIQRDCKELNFS